MEVAGLVLGVVGVSGLFSACIESFDIVVSAKHFSDDYEQLCALFSLQRARFGLWGESVGLIPNPNGQRLQYDKNLDRPDIKQGVERILYNIKTLLDDAGQVDRKYRLEADDCPCSEVPTPRGIALFKSSFDRFKSRIKKHQKDTTRWQVTQWALHDGKKFEDLIDRLEKFVDGLESITKSLGLLAEQYARLQEEIENISDVPSLKLLRDASSSHRSLLNGELETSSRRFIRDVAESVLEQKTIASGPTGPETVNTFVTALTRRSTFNESLVSDDVVVPGASPKSLRSSLWDTSLAVATSKDHDLQGLILRPGAPRALHALINAHIRAEQDGGVSLATELKGTGDEMSVQRPETADPGIKSEEVPQNQRLVRKLLEKSKQNSLSFAAGDAKYGEKLGTIKREDENIWHGFRGNLVLNAHSGSYAAKRMFVELRNIRLSKVPFISAVPVEDSLDKVLASIEGPPETSYEGGVFFVTVKLSQDPQKAPLMRFQTKIYHPNISPRGNICADYGQKWNPNGAGEFSIDSGWYHRKPGESVWSLGALLTALCGLLALPDVDDPLVPEIAQKYIEDYDDYCRSAKIYTQKYALAHRPNDGDLVFLEEFDDSRNRSSRDEPSLLCDRFETQPQRQYSTERQPDAISPAESLASGYDVMFPEKDHDLDDHKDIRDANSSIRGINFSVFSVRSSPSVETIVSHDMSGYTSEIVRPEPSQTPSPELATARRSDPIELGCESFTIPKFEELFPSIKRLHVFHDDNSVDRSSNIRVEAAVHPNGYGQNTMIQLFHVQIQDLILRQFSLRKFCRDFEREVCRSQMAYASTSVVNSSDKTASQLFATSLGAGTGTGRGTVLSESSKTNIRCNDMEQKEPDHGLYHNGDSTSLVSTNTRSSSYGTIKLELSSCAVIYLTQRGCRATERYEFEYWGYDYTWRKVARRECGLIEVYFELLRIGADMTDSSVAFIVPKITTGVGDSTNDLVPPCCMWISDEGIVAMTTELAEIVVATGLFALIDHCIRTRPEEATTRRDVLQQERRLEVSIPNTWP